MKLTRKKCDHGQSRPDYRRQDRRDVTGLDRGGPMGWSQRMGRAGSGH